MPLTNVQADILRLLASRRDPESYVAGSTPINRTALRYSGDIDVFHDREERVAIAAAEDSALLENEGYALQWIRREPNIYSVLAKRFNEATKLEWVADSDFRFFPTIPDETFGYILHPVDLAANKVMAAASRREVRDLVDAVTIHETILTLGAVIWAAVEKAPGFSPEGLIAEIRRNAQYPLTEWKALIMREPIDPAATMTRLREVLNEADAFVARMPTDKVGLLFLKGGKVVQPDPENLQDYQTHAGQRRGHWPSSSEITAAMFERAAQEQGAS